MKTCKIIVVVTISYVQAHLVMCNYLMTSLISPPYQPTLLKMISLPGVQRIDHVLTCCIFTLTGNLIYIRMTIHSFF